MVTRGLSQMANQTVNTSSPLRGKSMVIASLSSTSMHIFFFFSILASIDGRVASLSYYYDVMTGESWALRQPRTQAPNGGHTESYRGCDTLQDGLQI
ncbi:hypothetical protein BDV41DRAFT_459184 [Aspergillus transmontanensis]|uniref:Uncharacterized protein n=1 Tax=Aspergillus transmontanensis TaxID=1034304 RepID=A0A5N6VKQ6_9EURO|nr:hypothetical protein BDV41DRAFT_459184 [Aspergillus transmontanensis]